LARDFDVLASLVNVNTIKARSTFFTIESIKPYAIEGSEEATARSSTWPAQKDDLSVDLTSADTSLVCGVHDIEIVENLVDVLFPQCTGFGVSLQGLEHWKYQRAVNFLLMARAIPVGVGVANSDVCRLGRIRGVDIGVSTAKLWNQAGQDKARQRLLASDERQAVSIPREAIDPK
jgi:hypothetical protein